jgi:hypothetical protein
MTPIFLNAELSQNKANLNPEKKTQPPQIQPAPARDATCFQLEAEANHILEEAPDLVEAL